MRKLKTLQTQLQTLPTKSPINQLPKAKKNWGKGRGGRAWRRKRLAIFERDSFTCQICHRVGQPQAGKDSSLELDHIINLANGGKDNDSNLQTVCYSCHKQKTAQESNGEGYQKVHKP